MALSRARLKRVEAATKKATAPRIDDEAVAQKAHDEAVGRFRRAFAEIAPELFAFIERHVSPNQRLSLMNAFVANDEYEIDTLRLWASQPFALWATMPSDYVFPWALVDTFYRPADTLKMGDACERCGLCVPVYTFQCGDTKAFPACPACGGTTSSAAFAQAGPVTDPEQLTNEE